ncbi:hypothetical protein ACDQ55_01960 [Chitinophaga sp. 30R24]|uniref:hypothetical protein n=1 Tax=Chitinophaga sp. 30R24 TaxID=3248838 RepID=UPI003B90DE3D
METTSPSEELQQLNSWKEEVNEVRDEVKLMRERLEQIELSKASKDIMTQVERFENRLLRQQEVADEMHHDIKQCAKSISPASAMIVHNDRPVDNFHAIQRRMETFQELFVALKDDFNHFMPANV